MKTYLVYTAGNLILGAYKAKNSIEALNLYAHECKVPHREILISKYKAGYLYSVGVEPNESDEAMSDRIVQIINTIIQEGGALSASQLMHQDLKAHKLDKEMRLEALVKEVELIAVMWFDLEVSKRRQLIKEHGPDSWFSDECFSISMRAQNELVILTSLAARLGLPLTS